MRYVKELSSLAIIALLAGCGGSGSGGSNPATAVTPSAPATPPPSAEHDPAPRLQNCWRDSWVAGTAELCNGTLVYYDYVYDDYGADAGIVSLDPLTLLNLANRGGQNNSPIANVPGLLSPAAGDQRYPAGLENSADLVRLMLSVDGDSLLIQAELNTLRGAHDALVGVAIDTDNNPATGGGHWQRLAIASDGWEQLFILDQGDPDSNLLSKRVPLPEGATWRVQAAVAQPDGTVMNVAFRGTDELARADGLINQVAPDAGNFWEDRQARALAQGDISEFTHTLEVADLHNGVTRLATPPSGFQQRVYTSRFSLGEGVAMPGIPGRDDGGLLCGQSFNYLGKYQPYGVYIPEQLPTDEPAAMQLVLHGCEANHASQINQPMMQQRFADELGRILVAPLGRGPYGFYTGLSERDVLDVMADMEAHYAIDPDRRFVSGYSMGGFGALHMASHYPHKFAGLVNWVGFTGSLYNLPELLPQADELLQTLANGLLSPLLTPLLGDIANTDTSKENVIDYLGNLLHIPSAHLYSGGDPIVQVTQALALAQRLTDSDLPEFHFFLHPVAEHLTLMALDDWRKEARLSQDWVRISNPPRVRYLFDPTFDYPELDIVHNRAYWASDLVSRDGGEAWIDLHAPGCGDSQALLRDEDQLGLDPVPWIGHSRTVLQREPLPASGQLSGTLNNVSQVHIDSEAICLAQQPLVFDLHSDGPATLSLSDGRNLTLNEGRNQGSL